MWARGRRLSTLLVVPYLAACAPEHTYCPLPTPQTPHGSLAIREVHDFGRSYEVYDATYFLDDCLFYQTGDTALLRKPEITLPTRAVPAGKHELRLSFKLRSDFQSNMKGWEWYTRLQAPLDVDEDTEQRLVVRLREEGEGDPRERLKLSLERVGIAPQ
jgi:hypothetical protein